MQWVLLAFFTAARAWDARPGIRGDPLQRVERELNASLHAYPRITTQQRAERLLLRILSDPKRSALILGHRLLVDKEFLLTPKGIHHVEFVRTVMERVAPEHPNFAYQFEWNADGASRGVLAPSMRVVSGNDGSFKSEDQIIREGCIKPKRMDLARVKPKSLIQQKVRTPIPRLVIAKKYGYDQCGILMPNVYFDDLVAWGRATQLLDEEASQKPLHMRDPRAFWRGAIRSQPHCSDESGNHARLEAALLSMQRPDLFDVRCIECKPRLDWSSCALLNMDTVPRLPSGEHVNASHYLNYRFLLNLPGSVSGSYSRNLNHLWATGSIVVLWEHPYVEWYYPGLSSGRTHLDLSPSSISDFERVARDEKRQIKLAENARRVHDEFICSDCLANYWRLLVDRVNEHFHLRSVLEDPVSLRRVLARLPPGLRLVEFNNRDRETTTVRVLTERRQLLNLAKYARFRPKRGAYASSEEWNSFKPPRHWQHAREPVSHRRNDGVTTRAAQVDKTSESWTLTREGGRYDPNLQPTLRPTQKPHSPDYYRKRAWARHAARRKPAPRPAPAPRPGPRPAPAPRPKVRKGWLRGRKKRKGSK